MIHSDRKPLVGPDGEVREITAEDMKHATRGRPPLPESERKRRMQVMLDPEVVERLKADGGNVSARINQTLRDKLGL